MPLAPWEPVATALGAEVHNTAGKLTPLCAEVVVLHLELGNRVLRRNNNRQVDVTMFRGCPSRYSALSLANEPPTW